MNHGSIRVEPVDALDLTIVVDSAIDTLAANTELAQRPLMVGDWSEREHLRAVHGYAWLADAGRDPATFGIEGRLDAGRGTPDDWRQVVEMWRGFGASHLSVTTNGVGGADAHIQRLHQVRDVLAP